MVQISLNTLNRVGLLVASLVLWLCLVFAAWAQERAFTIFAAMPKPEEQIDWVTTLRTQGFLQPGQDLSALPEDRRRVIAALQAAEEQPSMATALGILAQFPTVSADDDEKTRTDNNAFRLAVVQAATDLFLMADAAKYELIILANKDIHADAQKRLGEGIAVSVRVGSTGVRFAQWLAWVEAGRPFDRSWQFTDPITKQTVTFTGMPVDPGYRDAKLSKADDDLTNRVRRVISAANRGAEETINGDAAAGFFQAVTEGLLADFPEEHRAAVLGNRRSIHPGEMKVEFLSPTDAVGIMGVKALREDRGWEVTDLGTRVDFLGEWILANKEKYNGLYAAEQLHAYGMDKGMVTQDVTNPAASTIPYKESATDGVLRDIVGQDVFPEGIKDPFGWMATNYRQLFVNHAGDVDSLAKYCLRMLDWWKNVNLTDADLLDMVNGDPGLTRLVNEFNRLSEGADDIRNAANAEARNAAITALGGEASAITGLTELAELMMISGQRKHVDQAARALADVLLEDSTSRGPLERREKPLTLDDILDRAAAVPDGPQKADNPYVAFRTTIDAFANGYGNLPPDVAAKMAQDMASFVDDRLAGNDGLGEIDAYTRLVLIDLLKTTTARARVVGADMASDAAALGGFIKQARADFGDGIDQQLKDLGEPDLSAYLAQLREGRVTRRRLRLLPSALDGSGWPRIEEVEIITRPTDVGADMKKIARLGKLLRWSDQTMAESLSAYMNGPDFDKPNTVGPPPRERTYADDAVAAYLALTRLTEGADAKVEFVRRKAPDGSEVTVQIKGTRYLDPALNSGAILFEIGMRRTDMLRKIYGVGNDLKSIATFGQTLHGLTVGRPDQTEEEKAKALAVLAAEGFGGITGLAEKLGTDEIQKWMDTHMGQGTIVGSFGQTTGALLSSAGTAFQTPEDQEMLASAFAKDLLTLWQPQVAGVLVMHAMYRAGSDYYLNETAKSDFLDLLVQNGDWKFPSDGQPPQLRRVLLRGASTGYIQDDPKSRAEQCKKRQRDVMLGQDAPQYRPIGLEHLLKIPRAELSNGSQICKNDGKVGCIPEPGRMVKPRDDMLRLFEASAHPGSDPILLANADAIEGLVGWGEWDFVIRTLTADDGSLWTAERLKTHGIFPPTREDASRLERKPVSLDTPEGGEVQPTDTNRLWVHAGIRANLGKGGRKLLGYLASQYWVRRQYIMECVMLDPLIKEAGRRALKASYPQDAPDDYAARIAELDARLRKLDETVWANIAPSADPYKPGADNTELPNEQKLAIYAHWLDSTRQHRLEIKEIASWFSGTPQPDRLPEGFVRHVYFKNSGGSQTVGDGFGGGIGADLATGQAVDRALTDPKELDRLRAELKSRATTVLREMSDIAVRYEDGFAQALTRIGDIRKLAAQGDGYALGPVYVELLPKDSFAPPDGGYREVRDHVFPTGRWFLARASEQDQELLTRFNFLDMGFAADGSMGAALRKWEDGYRGDLADARNGLGEVIDGFRITLPQEEGAFAPVVDAADKNPFAGLFNLPLDDLAQRHPLWPRLLRQTMQARTAENAYAYRDDVSRPEFEKLAGSWSYDDPAQRMSRWIEEQVEGESSKNVISVLNRQFDGDAERLLDAAADLFEIDMGLDRAFVTVTEPLDLPLTMKPIVGEDRAVISQANILAWSDHKIWEIYRDPYFSETLPRQADINLPEEADPFMNDPDLPPFLQTCVADRPDSDWAEVTTLFSDRSRAPDGVRLPLTTPGAFKLRVTAMTSGDVPLARYTVPLDVVPAQITGELELIGDPIRPDDTRALVGTIAGEGEEGPRVNLYDSGPFRAQMCGALSEALMIVSADRPIAVEPDAAAETMEMAAVFLQMKDMPLRLGVSSEPVPMRLRAPGLFELKEPLKVVLQEVPDVPVTLNVTDYAARPVQGADSTLTVNGAEEQPGPGPFALGLRTGDIVEGRAWVDTDTGRVEAQEQLRFDAAVDTGLTLAVELPLYEPGNLDVSGAFVLPDANAQIAGGWLSANILQGDRQAFGGSAYAFRNNRRAVAANGLSMEALAWADDQNQTFYRATGMGVTTLPRGGMLKLPDQVLRPFSTEQVDTLVLVTDWAGQDIDPRLLTVTLDGTRQPVTPAGYPIPLSFDGLARERTVRAAMQANGQPISEQVIYKTDDIGDPLNPLAPADRRIALPVFMPGSLRLSGQVTAASGISLPASELADLRVTDPSGADLWTHPMNERFVLDLARPVLPGAVVQVVATVVRDGVTYTGQAVATAPAAFSDRARQLDLGEIELKPADGLFDVPRLIGAEAEAVEKRGAPPFKVQVVYLDGPKDPTQAGRIYNQSPAPHQADRPSRLPAGAVITVAAYRKTVSATMPNVSGQPGDIGQQMAFAAGFVTARLLPGPPAPDGVSPGTIGQQTPIAGTVVDNPATATVNLFVYGEPEVTVSARPAPTQPETPPDTPTEQEEVVVLPQEDADDDPPDPTPATAPPPSTTDETTSVAGLWGGKLRLEKVNIKSRMPDFNLDLTCAAFEACASQWGRIMTGLYNDEVEEQRQADAQGGGLGDALTAPVDGALDGIALGILIGVGLGGIAVFDAGFAGLDMGLLIQGDDPGNYALRAPGLDPQIEQVLNAAQLTELPDGRVRIRLDNHPLDSARLSVDGHAAGLNDTLDLDLSLDLSDRSTGSSVQLDLRGSFDPVDDLPPNSFDAIAAQVMSQLQNPSARVASFAPKLAAEARRLSSDR
ncbi:MAG: hypothetical protein AB3N23_08460 [Paracoccaceae bacterium]